MRGRLYIIGKRTLQTILDTVRNLADGYEVIIRAATRNDDQNAKMWAMLGDISAACPNGHKQSPDDWKCAFMRALQHEVRFVMGLDGEPFPVGYRSSKLSKRQMADLITIIYQFGDANGVVWSEPHPDQRAAERGYNAG